MQLRVPLAVAGLGLVVAAPAAAKQKPITGTLPKPGYRVSALAANGSVRSVAVRRGKFALVPPASAVTLQLQDARGHYAGPVVVGKRGKNVVLGVRAGAALGRIALKRGFGIAHVKPSALVTSVNAAAKGSAPVGAGRLGYVKRRGAGRGGAGRDADRDGIPGAIDIDDDGDLVQDHVDPDATKARAAVTYSAVQPIWLLNVGLESSFLAGDPRVAGYALNWNARNAALPESNFAAYIDKALDLRGVIFFQRADIGLECRAFWCDQLSGTKASDLTGSKRWPVDFQIGHTWSQVPRVDSFNPDREALQLVTESPASSSAIRPHATAAQVSPSDVLEEHIPASSSTALMANVSYFFGTVPALAAWSDGSPTLTPVSYPVAADGPGSQRNPIPLTPGADGHYRLRMAVWPPQSAIGGGSYQTLGHLFYGVVGRTNGAAKQVFSCNGALSDPSPNALLHDGASAVDDPAGDRAIEPGDTITFTVDLSACFASSGMPAWTPGAQSVEVFVSARALGADVSEGVGFAFKPQDPPQSGGGGSTPPSSPATGSWRFAGGSPERLVDWTVHPSVSGITRIRIQFHEATPLSNVSSPAGWSCAPVTVSQPSDAIECANSSGSTAGTDVSGRVELQSAGSNGMPVTLTVTKDGTDTQVDLTQQP